MADQPRRASYAARIEPRFGLLDYVVLEMLDAWDELKETVISDVMMKHQREAILLVSAELAGQGLPLELALELTISSLEDTIVARSSAIDATLGMLANSGFINTEERGYPLIRLTSEGRGMLKVLRRRAQEFDAVFQHLPPAYFLANDLMGSNLPARSRHSIRRTITDMVGKFVNMRESDLQEELRKLGRKLSAGAAPRAYKLSKRFASQTAKHRPGLERT